MQFSIVGGSRGIKTLNLPGWTACAASRVASPHCASPRRPAPRVSLGRANKSPPRMCAAKCVYCTVYKYWAQRSLTSHKFSFGFQFKVFEAYGSSSLPFVNTDFANELRLRVGWNYFWRGLVGLERGHSENWWWEPNREIEFGVATTYLWSRFKTTSSEIYKA